MSLFFFYQNYIFATNEILLYELYTSNFKTLSNKHPRAFHKHKALMLKDIFWTKSVKEIGNDSITMNQ